MLSTAFIFFCTDFVNAEERNRRAHAENGNTSVSFPAAPVQPPAPCVPQRADHYAASSLAPGPFLLHASFFPRLKEVAVDRAFFEQLCREPAAAPEAPDRGFVLRRISSKLLTAIMRSDFMLLRACAHELNELIIIHVRFFYIYIYIYICDLIAHSKYSARTSDGCCQAQPEAPHPQDAEVLRLLLQQVVSGGPLLALFIYH